MRAAEADQCVRRIAKTEQRAANFKIKVDFRGARNSRLPQVENRAKKHEGRAGSARDHNARLLLPEKPDDLAPTTHELPPNTEETTTTP